MKIKMYRYLIQDTKNTNKVFWTSWTSELITPNNHEKRFTYTFLNSYESLKNYDNNPEICKIVRMEMMEEDV